MDKIYYLIKALEKFLEVEMLMEKIIHHSLEISHLIEQWGQFIVHHM